MGVFTFSNEELISNTNIVVVQTTMLQESQLILKREIRNQRVSNKFMSGNQISKKVNLNIDSLDRVQE